MTTLKDFEARIKSVSAIEDRTKGVAISTAGLTMEQVRKIALKYVPEGTFIGNITSLESVMEQLEVAPGGDVEFNIIAGTQKCIFLKTNNFLNIIEIVVWNPENPEVKRNSSIKCEIDGIDAFERTTFTGTFIEDEVPDREANTFYIASMWEEMQELEPAKS